MQSPEVVKIRFHVGLEAGLKNSFIECEGPRPDGAGIKAMALLFKGMDGGA